MDARSGTGAAGFVASLALLVLATTGLATGCGVGVRFRGADATTRLTQDQLHSALLTAEELGPAFVADHAREDRAADLGCLTEHASDTGPKPAGVRSAHAAFTAGTGLGLPRVAEGVASLPDEDAARRWIRGMERAMSRCHVVDVTDENGIRSRLQVVSNTTRLNPMLDDQLNVAAIGSLSDGRTTIELAMWASTFRLRNHVATVTFLDMQQSARGRAAALENAMAQLFVSVAQGHRPVRPPVSLGIPPTRTPDSLTDPI